MQNSSKSPKGQLKDNFSCQGEKVSCIGDHIGCNFEPWALNWSTSYVFVDFNKNTCTPDVIVWLCFSMAIPNRALFLSLSFIFEEQNISKLQT